MTTVNQGMSVEEIERVVAQRVANAIEAIAIYETKTNMARKSISQTEQQECKARTSEPDNSQKKMAKYWQKLTLQGHGEKEIFTAGPSRLCPKWKTIYMMVHVLQCTVQISGHLVRNCMRPTNDNTTNNQRGTGISQKVNCYECGNQGHYRSDCPEQKNHENQTRGTRARGAVHALREGETDQDPNNTLKDEDSKLKRESCLAFLINP
ncbi:retrotransposon protein, putative, ty3-gypsy subclass [Tanacetum coccineum]